MYEICPMYECPAPDDFDKPAKEKKLRLISADLYKITFHNFNKTDIRYVSALNLQDALNKSYVISEKYYGGQYYVVGVEQLENSLISIENE